MKCLSPCKNNELENEMTLDMSYFWYSDEAMLQLAVPMIIQQDLLLECKPLVDWMKVAVVHDNRTYILGVNPDPVLVAVDNELMEH